MTQVGGADFVLVATGMTLVFAVPLNVGAAFARRWGRSRNLAGVTERVAVGPPANGCRLEPVR